MATTQTASPASAQRRWSSGMTPCSERIAAPAAQLEHVPEARTLQMLKPWMYQG